MVHDTTGNIVGEWGIRKWLDVETLNPTKRRNVHISRQSLRAELLASLHNDDNIAWGHCLKEISHNSKSEVSLEFQINDRNKIAQADLVVGADGIRSSVRGLLIGEHASPLQYLGCIVILGICPLDTLADIENELLD